jgi:hypothetical protein
MKGAGRGWEMTSDDGRHTLVWLMSAKLLVRSDRQASHDISRRLR